MRVAACGLVVVLLGANPALAAAPLKGSVYRGSLGGSQAEISISFRVSPGGGEVESLHISALPIYCPGNGPPGTPTIIFAKAGISPSNSNIFATCSTYFCRISTDFASVLV